MKDPYAILGVTQDASEEDIRHAYSQIAKKTHPDITGGNPELTEKFREATDAYHFLMNSDNRSAYEYFSTQENEYSETFYEEQTMNAEYDARRTEDYIRYMYSQIEEVKSAALSKLIMGIVYFAIGCSFTIFSYLHAEPGEYYRVYTGALIIGMCMFVRNMYYFMRFSFLAQDLKEEMWENI